MPTIPSIVIFQHKLSNRMPTSQIEIWRIPGNYLARPISLQPPGWMWGNYLELSVSNSRDIDRICCARAQTIKFMSVFLLPFKKLLSFWLSYSILHRLNSSQFGARGHMSPHPPLAFPSLRLCLTPSWCHQYLLIVKFIRVYTNSFWIYIWANLSHTNSLMRF